VDGAIGLWWRRSEVGWIGWWFRGKGEKKKNCFVKLFAQPLPKR